MAWAGLFGFILGAAVGTWLARRGRPLVRLRLIKGGETVTLLVHGIRLKVKP